MWLHITRMLWLLTFTLWSTLFTIPAHGYREEPATCELIRADMCSHLKYNMTRMPNFLGHQTQEEAIQDLRQWKVAETLNCSRHIKFFLCSLFMPMCTSQLDGPLVIEVCRSMCLQVKADCEPTLTALQVNWPLNCSRLPESSSKEQLCMAPGNNEPSIAGSPPSYFPMNAPVTRNPGSGSVSANKPGNNIQAGNPVNRLQPNIDISGIKDQSPLSGVCPSMYVLYENSSCTDLCNSNCRDCVPNCNQDIYFTESHKHFAYIWIAIWSALCVASTLFTIATFCIDTERFRYPARPIIFMAFCYLMYSTAYLIRLFMPAREIICKPDQSGQSVMIMDGLESTLCIVVFLIQYYFGMASNLWWAVLTLSWYLAASRKWGLEAINSIACYFHLVAWAVPAILTITILVTGKVDSDELTGMCYVGNHDEKSLIIFVIIPLALLLFIGDTLILCGFCSLFRIRTSLKSNVDNTNLRKLEKLMAKIGVFSILYSVPAVCILGGYIHHCMNMSTWRCLSSTVLGGDSLKNSIPTVEIQMLKIFMSFAIGITISMWVLSAKTWQSCEKRLCRASREDRNSNYKRSYVVGSPTDRNAFVQHYNFPIRQQDNLSNHAHFVEAKV